MKTAFLFYLFSLPLAAAAQKLQATAPAATYHIGSEKTFLYRNPADTAASKSSFFLYPGNEAVVVGEFSPRWVVVKREGFLFLASAQKLADYRAGDMNPLPIDQQTKLITYEGVVEVPGVSKADLYLRAHAWVAKTYHSANDVIQMHDKEAGQLIVKGVSRVASRGNSFGVVRHTLTIYVKDGRYKYVLSDLMHDAAGAANIYSAGPLEQAEGKLFAVNMGAKKPWEDIKAQANHNARTLVADLQASMMLKGKKDPTDF